MSVAWTNLLTSEGIDDLPSLRARIFQNEATFESLHEKLLREAAMGGSEAPNRYQLYLWSLADSSILTKISASR
ncbi:hypothetical protein D9M72_603730 [compost metagenome]